jgi:hypothetical protein
MKNKTNTIFGYCTNMNVWLILIVVLASLNAIGDLVLFFFVLGYPATNTSGVISLNMHFVQILANRILFLITTPISLVSSVLLLVSISMHRLFLFKLFFFIMCVVGLGHLLINAITLHPFISFKIPMPSLSTDGNLITDMMVMPFRLLQSATPFFIFAGIIMAFGVVIACMVYFTRSKKIALYFGNRNTI